MEEMQKIAEAYYNAAPNSSKKVADDFIDEMAENGDGNITFSVFLNFTRKKNYSYISNPHFFNQLNLNLTGTLDRREALTLFYIINSGRPICIGCGNTRPIAATACQKTFVTNRVGDFGLLLGILGLYWITGSFEFRDLFEIVNNLIENNNQVHFLFVTLCSFLLFAGAVAKSAQFPLHVWLPDAMELITTIFFTCVKCFDSGGDTDETPTFDLCCSCFCAGSYCHGHNSFVDNFVLLQMKRRAEKKMNREKRRVEEKRPKKVNQNVKKVDEKVSSCQAIVPATGHHANQNLWQSAMLGVVVAGAKIAQSLCTIM